MANIIALILTGIVRYVFQTRRGFITLDPKEAIKIEKREEGYEKVLESTRKECAFVSVTCNSEESYKKDKAALQTFLSEHGEEYGFVSLETPSEKEDGSLVKVVGQNNRAFGYQLQLSKRVQSHTA